MLNMSKLPSHKIENGIIIFDEPCSISHSEIEKLIPLCDGIALAEDCEWDSMQLYAIASSKEYNKQLTYLLSTLSRDKYSWVRHTGFTDDALTTIY